MSDEAIVKAVNEVGNKIVLLTTAVNNTNSLLSQIIGLQTTANESIASIQEAAEDFPPNDDQKVKVCSSLMSIVNPEEADDQKIKEVIALTNKILGQLGTLKPEPEEDEES